MMTVFRCIIFMIFVSVHQCRLPDKVYCVNDQCSEPISKARTLLKYNSADPDLMSFRANSEAIILMKSAGTNADLWFANINGNKGFVNSEFLRESKIYEKNPQVIKPVEDRRTPPPNVEPNKVQQPHEVIEGTTIYTTEATPNIPMQETPPKVSQQAPNEEVTPFLEDISQENTTPQPQILLSVEQAPHKLPQNEETHVNNLNVQESIQDQLSVVDRPEMVSNNVLQPQNIPPPTPEVVTNNVAKPQINNVNVNVQESIQDQHSVVDRPEMVSNNVLHPQNIPPPTPEVVTNNLAKPQINNANVNVQESIQDQHSVVDRPEMLSNNVLQPQNIPPPTPEVVTNKVVTPQINNVNKNVQESIRDQHSVVDRPEMMANNELQPQDISPSTPETAKNNEAKPLETAPSQNILQGLPPHEALHNVNDAKYNEGATLELVPQPQALLSTSGASMGPKTTVHVSEKTKLNPEIPTQPQAQESEQNVSVNSLSYVENITANDILSQTNEVPERNVVDNNIKPDVVSAVDQVPDTPQQDNGVDTLTSEEKPPENINGESMEERELSQESYEVTTQLDVPSTTELPATVIFYQHDTTTEGVYSSSEVTTPTPNEITSEDRYEYTTTIKPPTETTNTFVSHAEQEQYESTTSEEITNPATESTQSDKASEGFFSNVYSTISDIWPSTTEVPIETIFNTEAHLKPLPKENLNSILENIKEPEDPNHIYHSETISEPEIHMEPEIPVENVEANEKFSFVKYFTSAFLSVLGGSEETRALFATPGETCYSNEYPQEGKEQNKRLLTFLMTTAGALLLFILGYYYIDAKRQDGKFVGMVNSLQRDLLCTTKECEILKEELTTTKTKLAGIEDNSFGMDDMVQSLKEEIQELHAQNERLRVSLDDNEKLLRVSENTAGELQNTLIEVENTLSELLAERAQSEDHIAELNGKIQAFEEELISASRERDNFQLKYVSSETALEEARKQMGKVDELNHNLAEASNTIELQRHEIAALKDALKEFQRGSSNVDVASLIDHTEIKAKLAKAMEEKNALELKFKTEYKERTRLQEELQSTQETLHTTSQRASEATTRLEVLEKYFQERESELVKELSSKESLWLSKQGESTSTVEKMELLRQEVQRHKEKCDALTLELAEQESAKRTAVAELEARAHNAWLEARAAKRDAAADRDAAAALRRKLASLTQPEGTASPHQRIASPIEAVANGSGVGMLPPPLPLAFLPPPPLLPPLLPPLPRPPPLGCLPSPHPPRYSDRYSPDSRYSPESRYSPDSRYSQEPLRRRDSPDSRYSPERRRRSPAFSPRTHRRRTPSRERYPQPQGRSSRQRNGPVLDTETEYGSDSPTRSPPRRRRSYRHSGPSSGSGCSSESDK